MLSWHFVLFFVMEQSICAIVKRFRINQFVSFQSLKSMTLRGTIGLCLLLHAMVSWNNSFFCIVRRRQTKPCFETFPKIMGVDKTHHIGNFVNIEFFTGQ